ncbi:metallophosphoesterase [Anaerocolumna sp. AGMB13025]|uniref:metallophosphoesterase n=1 Tax=Anaerocolumna sp. AGMB13025 TaxID=3039116 RepID=UPI00241C2E85|nr:metallophosphoesterase [Anaerocolumna sp. AGMB13025]WFR55987.1 metallophosphoesterase [Anaerocolumna sp. AGMB13025]
MLAKVKRIEIEENRRIIAISDIHGNLNGLKELLKKINFSQDDYLFFVGDMVEKGPQSLSTLRYIMELTKTCKAYAVSGNCDSVAAELYDDRNHKELLNYLLRRKKSLLNEMCEALSFQVNKDTDMRRMKELLTNHYKEELEWICNLPDIIETAKFTFVHGGLTSGDLEVQEAEKVQCLDEFLKQDIYLDKYCIVGHWPVVLYCEAYPECNPIINKDKKIICIDGGNVLKSNGQLNAFMIPDINSEAFTFEYQDDLKTGIIREDQEETNKSHYIPWTPGRHQEEAKQSNNTKLIHWIDNKIEILEKDDEFSYCEHSSTKYRMWILNKYIYKEKDGYYCEDSTDYLIPVKSGDLVSLVETTEKGYLVKKNGVTGWYFGKIDLEK